MLLCSASGAKAAIISFTTAPTGTISTYTESGFVFTRTVGGVMSINNGTGSPFDPVTAGPFDANFLNYQQPAVVTLTAVGDAAFDLSTLKFAGAVVGNVFQVIGNFNIGGPATQSFTTDGTLETFSPNFGLGWTNLSSVVFSTPDGQIGLDNLNVVLSSPPAAVPEPASAAFLGLGSLALVVRRLRRRTSVVA